MVKTLVQAQLGTTAQIDAIIPLTAGYFNTANAIHFSNQKPDAVLRVALHPDQPVLTYEKNLMQREYSILKMIEQIKDIPYTPGY